MIKAIFYARFHPSKGPIIAHQVPENSITQDRPPHSSSPTPPKPLLDFPLLSPYLIPPQSLCNRLLTLRSPTTPHLIISHPICIVDATRYARNEFIFNFGIVIESKTRRATGMVEAYKVVVRRVAAVLRGLEVERGWLAGDERDGEGSRGDDGLWGSRVYAVCEMVLEDLNCYGECMIPIDDTTTLSLRLHPKTRPPPHVSSFHVPVLLITPSSLQTRTWDLTLQLLLPYINGINSVSRIAALADANVPLACEAIRQLVRHGCAILLDVFSFGASYAVTPGVGDALVRNVEVQEEGARYVAFPGMVVRRERVVSLLCSLRQGVRLREWCLERAEELEGVDVRRLVTFGVIKGILYRVRKVAVAGMGGGGVEGRNIGEISDKGINEEELSQLSQYLDGKHCFDQICTEMEMSEKDVMGALRGQDIQIIYC